MDDQTAEVVATLVEERHTEDGQALRAKVVYLIVLGSVIVAALTGAVVLALAGLVDSAAVLATLGSAGVGALAAMARLVD